MWRNLCGHMDQVGECWIVLLVVLHMTTTFKFMKRYSPSLYSIYGLKRDKLTANLKGQIRDLSLFLMEGEI